MNQPDTLQGLKIRYIFHPTDFSAASEVAFIHALKLTLATRSELNVLHVAGDTAVRWDEFPRLRETLARWKLLPPDSPPEAISDLGIGVRKVVAASDRPVEAALEYLDKHPADLVVLAIHQIGGLMRWMENPIGKPMAREAGQTTLYIPHGVTGFVSFEDGSVSLKNILVPIAIKPNAWLAIQTTTRLIRDLQLAEGTVTLLHVGAEGDMPAVTPPDTPGWIWNRMTAVGDPAAIILQTAQQINAGLIVMTTEGPDGFLDALRGSTSEQVLRKTRCPVASLPVGAS